MFHIESHERIKMPFTVCKNIDGDDFFKKLVLYFKHATIKLYLTLSHVGLVTHRIIEVMAWIPG